MPGKWIRKPTGPTTVVFIHGILSSSETCWRHSNGTDWPELLASDPAIPLVGVYAFTYKTDIFSGYYRLGDIVDDLKENLRLDQVLDRENVVFVCHSMGGIVTRKFILSQMGELGRTTKTIGLFLIASPSLGSMYANWLAPIATLFKHTQADALRFTQSNAWLLDLDKDFTNFKEDKDRRVALVGKELVEDVFVILPRFLRRQVVEPFSGAKYFGDPYKVPGSDHFSIAKVASKNDIQYRLLLQFIQEITKRSNTSPATSKVDTQTDDSPGHGISELRHIPLDGFVGVPVLSRQMLPRAEIAKRIINSVLHLPGGARRNYVYLKGPGGCGKSTLAAMIARDPEIRDGFPDGVFWVSVGQKPDVSKRLASWLNYIPNRPLSLSLAEEASNFLKSYFKDRKSLIILDDIWDIGDLTHFKVAGGDCGVILTGRELKIVSSLDAHIVEIGGLLDTESNQLLTLRSGTQLQGPLLAKLGTALGNLPLALELAAYQLRSGATPAQLLEELANEQDLLRSLEVPGYEHESDEEITRNLSINACLNLSLRRLPPDLLLRFAQLSILQPSAEFDGRVAMKIWDDTSLGRANEILRALASMSLLEQLAAHEGRSDDQRRYRMHSIIRAKAIGILTSRRSSADPLALGLSVQDLLKHFLRRSNSNYPHRWHEVEDDGHLINHLISYIIRIDEIECLLSILKTRSDGSELFSPNAWYSLRSKRSQQEAFPLDVQQAYGKMVSYDCRGLTEFETLARSFLTLVSFGEMNKGINVDLCIGLVRAGLWSEGVAASHARRRFHLGDIAAVAQVLTEPLRSRTMQEAFDLAQGDLSRADTVSQFVRCAVLWEGPLRPAILEAAVQLLKKYLGPRGKSWRSSGSFRVERITALRASIELIKVFGKEIDGRWTSTDHVIDFVREFLNWVPPSRPISLLSDKEEYEHSVVALETLLYIGVEGPSPARSQARAVLSRLQKALEQREEYSIMCFKINSCLDLGAQGPDLESAAVNALKSSYASIYSQVALHHQLWEFEGLSGFAKLLVRHYGAKAQFFDRIAREHIASPSRYLFLEQSITSLGPKLSDRQLADTIRRDLGWVIFSVLERGSIAPSDAGPYNADEEYKAVLRALVQIGLIQRHGHLGLIVSDLSRISNDTDRVHVLRIVLPSIEFLAIDLAEQICGSFAHEESEALARLMTGTRVAKNERRRFLAIALNGFSKAKSSTIALRALCEYIGSYADQHLSDMVQAATAFAEGIGDTDHLKCAYARASVGVRNDVRLQRLRAPFWYSIDTMPTHAPVSILPRSRSVTTLPFWNRDARLKDGSSYELLSGGVRRETGKSRTRKKQHTIEGRISDSEFVTFAISYLSKIPSDTIRADICEEVADIAQELVLRGMSEYAQALASAMFDTAIMYR